MKISDILAKLTRRGRSSAREVASNGTWRPRGSQTEGSEDAPNADRSEIGSDFPHLGVATDTGRMREVFQRHLPFLDEEAVEVGECRVFQTRLQRGLGRCVVQYIVRLSGPKAGSEREQWFTGIMYAGEGARARSDSGEPAAHFAPSHHIPELDMLVGVFPHDHWLPTLPLLMEGPPSGAEAPLLQSFGPGDWRIETWRAEPVRYLAEMRATLRLTVRAREAVTGAEREKRFYAKVYASEEGERTHDVIRALWKNAAADQECFSVGRPVVYLRDARTSIQEEVIGPTLEEVIVRKDGDVALARRLARTLANMHLGEPVTLRLRLPRREASIMRKAGDVLPLACPHLRTEIEEVVDAVVDDLREVPPAPTHCDFLSVHVLVDGDRLALIDLDEFAQADPILDVARFLVPLATAPFRIPLPKERALPAARAFVEEYFAHVPSEWRDRLPLHYTIAVLKMAVGYSRSQEPGYADKVEALVREARGYLTNETWR